MKLNKFVRSFMFAMSVFCVSVTSITSQTPQAAAECAQEMIAHHIGNVAPAHVGCALNVAIYLRSLHGFEDSTVLRNGVTTAFTNCYPALPNSNALVNRLIDNLNEINDVNATTFGGSSCLEDMWSHIDGVLAAANASAERQRQAEANANRIVDNAGRDGASNRADPHIKTLDGSRYHFQAEGIFTSFITTDGKFEIQSLQKGLQPKAASQNEAVAIKYHSTTLNFAVKTRSVYLNGRLFTPTLGNMKLADGLEFTQLQPDIFQIITPKGDSIIVKFNRNFLDFYLRLSPFNFGLIKGGIMGNADFNRKNDLTARTGEVIAFKDRIDRKLLYQVFGDSWRIQPSKSLFVNEILSLYPKFDANFPARLVDIMKFTSAEKKYAASLCQRKGITDQDILEDCLHDLALTNNPAFADSAEFAQKVKRNPNQYFRKDSPKSPGFRGTYSFEFTFSDGKKQTTQDYEVAVSDDKSGMRFRSKKGATTRYITNHAEKYYLNIIQFDDNIIQPFATKYPFSRELAREGSVETTRTELTKTIAGYSCRKYIYQSRTVSGELWVAESLKQTQSIEIEYLIGLTNGGFIYMATFPKFLSQSKDGMVLEANLKERSINVNFRMKSINTTIDDSFFDLTGVKIVGR